MIVCVTKESSEIPRGLIAALDFVCSARRRALRGYFWCRGIEKLRLFLSHDTQLFALSLCMAFSKDSVHPLVILLIAHEVEATNFRV